MTAGFGSPPGYYDESWFPGLGVPPVPRAPVAVPVTATADADDTGQDLTVDPDSPVPGVVSDGPLAPAVPAPAKRSRKAQPE